MKTITIGARIKLIVESIISGKNVGSTATILYVDDQNNVYVEWYDGKLTSYPEKIFLTCFELALS